MASIEYTLYRIKFIVPYKSDLLDPYQFSPASLFHFLLQEKPSMTLRPGITWHIGNLTTFTDDTGYFAVGRTTKATISKFNEVTSDFVEEELETSPYTHCVYATSIGLLGIAHKSSLATTTDGVARRLESLFSKNDTIRSRSIAVEILPIPDPTDFLTELTTAYQISKFTATFKGPNPWDADAYFQRPLAALLNAANGIKGQATLKGKDLDSDVLTEIARSTAATGNPATARIKRSLKSKPETIKMKKDGVKRRYEAEEHNPADVIADLTQVYKRVRSDDQ